MPYGRIVHLQPVSWEEGWPLIGQQSERAGIGEPILGGTKPVLVPEPPCSPATSDTFDQPDLGKQWQWHANHQSDWWSLSRRRGWLSLSAMPVNPTDLSLTPHLLLQKFPAASFEVQTRILLGAPGISGGIVVVGMESAALLFHRHAQRSEICLHIGEEKIVIATVADDAINLRVIVREGGICSFACQTATGWIESERIFQAKEGTWIGAKIGLLAVADVPGAYADFQYFRFSPANP
jgi:beta-xylosidase